MKISEIEKLVHARLEDAHMLYQSGRFDGSVDLGILLHLTGLEDKVNLDHFSEWSIVAQWNPEIRNNSAGNFRESDAHEMLEASKVILEQL